MPVSTERLAAELTPSDVALQRTRFASWFPQYRRYSIKATIIDVLDVQPDFLQWLAEDGLVLPLDSDDRPVGSAIVSEIDDDNEDEDEDEDEDVAPSRDFSSLNQRIRQTIDKYDGAVFPKLDWSAPLDAAWMVPGATLRCTEPSDVYLLLKSSDFISKDVVQLEEMGRMAPIAAETCTPTLVLKKFFDMPRAHEFRCFVRAGELVCISQRDTGTYFEHLQDVEMRQMIQRTLLAFFDAVLRPNAGVHSALQPVNPFPLADFVWDAYLTRDLSRTLIVDVNPYLERTDALLWQWDEIESEANRRIQSSDDGLPALRIVTSRAQTTQSFPTYAHNMMPSDVFDLSHGADIANFARNFNQQLAQAASSKHEPDPAPSSSSSNLPPMPQR